MTAVYGMNPQGTGTLSDSEHLKNSVRDILTPPGSRVMRREYGGLLPDLIDEPMNDTTRLRCMSATVTALARHEPRYSTAKRRCELAGWRTRRGDVIRHHHRNHTEHHIQYHHRGVNHAFR